MQLLDASRVVAADYGFKEAIATQDTETIASMLINHGTRVRANLAMFIDLEGRIVAGSHARSGDPFPFAELLTLGPDGGAGLGSFGDQAFELVVAPVMAPDMMGWACLGFVIDDEFASRVADLTSLDVSIALRDPASSQSVAASSLAQRDREALSEVRIERTSFQAPNVLNLANDRFLTMVQPLSTSTTAILQTSMSAALEPYDQLRWQMITLFVISLGVAVLIARHIAGSVTRPLWHLVGAARRLAAGDYDQSVRAENRDEIGALATAFNEMRCDIRDRESEILYQSRHDALTDLPNRSVAVQAVRDAALSGDPDAPFAVVLLDLNGFKSINDSLGHAIGDDVLRRIAKRLQSVRRRNDLIARLDGDEFMLLLANTNERRARNVAKRVLRQLSEPVAMDDVQVRVSGTVGLAVWPEHGRTPGKLLRRANMAVYEAKRERQAISTYTPGEDEKQQRRMQIVQDLPDAIRNGDLSLFYQPKVEMQSRRVVEVEALARWTHPELGFVSPADFVPLAEQSGKVQLLTRWALKEAMNQARRLRKEGIDILVAVNLSALDLLDPELPDWILNALAERDLPASCFGLEVTESAVMDDPSQASRALRRLRDHGLGVAIDDFGTGYSSLSQLQCLPVTELKIDRSFVTPLTGESEAPAIVESIVNLGHVMGLQVTAEGIEDLETWGMLEALGCDKAQGYLMSKPLSGHALMDWLKVLPAIDALNSTGRARHRVYVLPDTERAEAASALA